MTSTTTYQAPGLGAAAVLKALHSPLASGLRRNLTELRYRGHRSGRPIALPVAYTRMDGAVAIRVGHADAKTWWRNFRQPQPVAAWLDGQWRSGMAHVAEPGSLEHEYVAATYQQTGPAHDIPAADPFVIIDLGQLNPPVPRTRTLGPAQSQALWQRWFANVTAGEALGFIAPALAIMLTRNTSAPAAAAALLFAAVIEGSVLGWFQARVLRTVLPGTYSRAWVFATALGVLVAWAVGVLPILAGDELTALPPWALVPIATVGGLVLLAAVGTAQWFVFRHLVAKAGRWVSATALAWLAGLAVFFSLTTPLWQPGQSIIVTVAVGLAGGLLMAATMAAITGSFLIRMLSGTTTTTDT